MEKNSGLRVLLEFHFFSLSNTRAVGERFDNLTNKEIITRGKSCKHIRSEPPRHIREARVVAHEGEEPSFLMFS